VRRLAILICMAFLSASLTACAAPDGDLSAIPGMDSPFASTYAEQSAVVAAEPGQDAKPPSGFVAFCDRNPGECRAPRNAPVKVAFTQDTMATLQSVNVAVNSAIRPEDDSDHYGVPEFWTVPVDGYGDCEDYALAKRKMLMLLGMPEPALRVSVVFNRAMMRHAVLTVVTDHGDYVLDNLQDEILPPAKTDYTWLERQDPASRTGWVTLNQRPFVADRVATAAPID
jgi:predicted transglutaminase-like cysteine proteinase